MEKLERVSEIVRLGRLDRVFAKVVFSDGSVVFEEFDMQDPGENRIQSSSRSFHMCKGPEIVRF